MTTNARNAAEPTGKLLGVFGTSAPLTYWTWQVVGLICDQQFGSHTSLLDGQFDPGMADDAAAGIPILLQSEIPLVAVSRHFIDHDLPRIIVSEPLLEVVDYLTDMRALPVKSAARYATQSVSALHEMVLCPGQHSLTLDEHVYDLTVTQLVSRISKHFGLELEPSATLDICGHLTADGADPSRTDVGSSVSHVVAYAGVRGDAGRRMAAYEDWLPPLMQQYDRVRKGTVDRFVWPQQIFPKRDEPDIILAGAVELLGPARILIGGYTLHLPLGTWRARVDILVEQNFSGNVLLVHGYVGADLQKIRRARLPTQGEFRLEIDLTVADPNEPIQILLCTDQGAIEGRLELLTIGFSRQPSSND